MQQDLIASRYDVALSFAGEDRAYVESVASALAAAGVRAFYDDFEESVLWGKNLFTHLADVYKYHAEYCVIFVSRAYAAKPWTKHEQASAQARAFTSEREYILPVRMDDTELPGLLPTVGYVDGRRRTPVEVATLIALKVTQSRFDTVREKRRVIEKEVCDLTDSQPIRDAVSAVLNSPQFPAEMATSGNTSLVPNPVRSGVSGQKQCPDRKLYCDLFLITRNVPGSATELYTYRSSWKAFLVPFSRRKAGDPRSLQERAEEVFEGHVAASPGVLGVSPTGEFCVSCKRNRENGELWLYVFEFHSAVFPPDSKLLTPEYRWKTLEELNRPGTAERRVNGDVWRGIRERFGSPMEGLPRSTAK